MRSNKRNRVDSRPVSAAVQTITMHCPFAEIRSPTWISGTLTYMCTNDFSGGDILTKIKHDHWLCVGWCLRSLAILQVFISGNRRSSVAIIIAKRLNSMISYAVVERIPPCLVEPPLLVSCTVLVIDHSTKSEVPKPIFFSAFGCGYSDINTLRHPAILHST